MTSVDEYTQKLIAMGCQVEPVTFDRRGANFRKDLHSFIRVVRLLRKYRPKLVFSVHAKPSIFVNIALLLVGSKTTKSLVVITGLGHAFIVGGPIRMLASFGYFSALSRADRVIFQNKDDYGLFIRKGWVRKKKSKVIVGSGVDTTYFEPSRFLSQQNSLSCKVVMMGRLIAQKGVYEFLDMASGFEKTHSNVEFIWAGEVDYRHPDSVSPIIFNEQSNAKFIGRINNVAEFLASTDILLFPSYREGVPRTIMEASCMKIPCIAFDVPGVREVVKDKWSGFLVPFKSQQELEKRVRLLVEDEALRQEMGEKARVLMVQRFDLNIIESAYFKEIKALVQMV